MIEAAHDADAIGDEDYATLARFRHTLRRFLRFSEEAAGEVGLTAQQYQALLAVRAAPDARMLVGGLAEQLLLRPHSTSGLVDRLEALGLVRRETGSDDRRQVTVALTPRAAELLTSLSTAHRAELRRIRPLLADLVGRL